MTSSDAMTVLVTGCAGFIGSKVTDLLLDQGHAVTGIDLLNEAYDVRLKEWRLAKLQERPGFEFHRTDITDWSSLTALFAQHSFDAVVNLAARAGVRTSVEDPWVYYQTNVVGSLNLLECCRRYGARKFVLSSTSSVYGNGPSPFREDQATDRPLSPYAASKKAAEALGYSYHYLHGLDVTVLRYFTVYGGAGRPDMSIFRFIRWISEGDPVILFDDGSQERDFTFVDDVARGTVMGLKPLGYEVINLGSDSPERIDRVIETIEEILGRKARIERRPAHPADIRATRADIGKAKRLLGWAPQTSLAKGLRAAADWYAAERAWASQLTMD